MDKSVRINNIFKIKIRGSIHKEQRDGPQISVIDQFHQSTSVCLRDASLFVCMNVRVPAALCARLAVLMELHSL